MRVIAKLKTENLKSNVRFAREHLLSQLLYILL
jgi:hypothetical protein